MQQSITGYWHDVMDAIWRRVMLAIIFEKNFLFYLSVMLEADPSK